MDPIEAFRIAEEKFSTSLFNPPSTISIERMREHLVETIQKYRETNDLQLLDQHHKFITGLLRKPPVGKENIPVGENRALGTALQKTVGGSRRKALGTVSNVPAEVVSTLKSEVDNKQQPIKENVDVLPSSKEPSKRAHRKHSINVEPRITRSKRSKLVVIDPRDPTKISDILEEPSETNTIENPNEQPLKNSRRLHSTKVNTSEPKRLKEDVGDSQSTAKCIEYNICQQPKIMITRISHKIIMEKLASMARYEQIRSPSSSVTAQKDIAMVRTPLLKTRTASAMFSLTSKKNDSTSKTLSKLKQQRKDKEEDMIKKREAVLQKQSEDKRRKRLEKEQKVKQQKEMATEKAKQRLLEKQKEKEEKAKLMQLEKQARLAKQREDGENRRLVAKQKANETRKAEEERVRKAKEEEEMQQRQQNAATPRYQREKEPLLPTDDCYDSDDERKLFSKPILPAWNRDEALQKFLRCIQFIDMRLTNTWFNLTPQVPDLQELFPFIDPRKLNRTSSAVWKQTPRFTMIPPPDV